MSDSVYKWARRELEAIRLNGHALNTAHLSALAVVAAHMADDSVQERVPLFELVVAEERDVLRRIRELHYRTLAPDARADHASWICVEDGDDWPCATMMALGSRAGLPS